MTAPVIVTVAKEKAKPEKVAAALLERCRQFYADPENEQAYQEWKKQKSR